VRTVDSLHELLLSENHRLSWKRLPVNGNTFLGYFGRKKFCEEKKHFMKTLKTTKTWDKIRFVSLKWPKLGPYHIGLEAPS